MPALDFNYFQKVSPEKALEDLKAFVSMMNDYRLVKRDITLPGSSRMENDAEHSFQLAMTAWFLITYLELPLNLNRVLLIALTHDLPELLAKDTSVFGSTPEQLASKESREAEAREKISAKWIGKFPEMISAMEAYHERKCPESNFVYALDKVLPVINIFLDNGRNWRRLKVTHQMTVDAKKEKVKAYPAIQKISELLLKELGEKHSYLFHQKESV